MGQIATQNMERCVHSRDKANIYLNGAEATRTLNLSDHLECNFEKLLEAECELAREYLQQVGEQMWILL